MIIVRTPTAAAYEISIYQAYPFYFWVLVFSSLFCAIVVLVRKSFSVSQHLKMYLGAYLLSILTNLVVILPAGVQGVFYQ